MLHMELFIIFLSKLYKKVYCNFESVNEILQCKHSNDLMADHYFAVKLVVFSYLQENICQALLQFF